MVYQIALLLTIVGGLNWGLVGVTSLVGTRFDLVEYIGTYLLTLPILTDLIYIIVGISALVVAAMMKNQ